MNKPLSRAGAVAFLLAAACLASAFLAGGRALGPPTAAAAPPAPTWGLIDIQQDPDKASYKTTNPNATDTLTLHRGGFERYYHSVDGGGKDYRDWTFTGTYTDPPKELTVGPSYTLTMVLTAGGKLQFDFFGAQSAYNVAGLTQTSVKVWDDGKEAPAPGGQPSGVGYGAGDHPNTLVKQEKAEYTFTVPADAPDKITIAEVYITNGRHACALFTYMKGAAAGTFPPPPGGPPVSGCPQTIARDWNTTWGAMSIHLDGDKVSGTYSNRSGAFGPGTFTGAGSAAGVEATWKDAKGEGTFKLTLSADGCNFTGTSTVTSPPPPPPGGPQAGPNSGGAGGPNPPANGNSSACADPGLQHCIDEWIDKAIALRNQNDPQNAPYRLSPYGTWLNRTVIAAYPPDEWETRYHLSKYCFILANYGKEQLAPVYQGNLPALQDFLSTCTGATGPGSGPGSATGPGSGPGPVSGPETPVSGMTLLAENRKVKAGDLVAVPVWLLKGTDLASLNFTVTYDPKVAVPEGDVTRGNLLGDSLFSANPKDSGVIRLGVGGSSGMNGYGTVAYLPFRAVGAPGAFTLLHLEVTTAANSGQAKVQVATIDGSIQIIGQEGALPGDCNGDGVVDARDAQCALDMSVGLIAPDLNLDMNGDGKVDAVDATLILQNRGKALLR